MSIEQKMCKENIFNSNPFVCNDKVLQSRIWCILSDLDIQLEQSKNENLVREKGLTELMYYLYCSGLTELMDFMMILCCF